MDVMSLFPNLVGSDYRRTSPADLHYNCIAWAVGESDRWWWPDPSGLTFWPDGLSRRESVESFVELFSRLGYDRVDNDSPDVGFEKVALFAKDSKPTHAARQLPTGLWSSKLGSGEDIEHPLYGLESDEYGRVVAVFRRPVNSA